MPPLTIAWLRNDLRLDDNPALRAAADRGDALPVWIRNDRAHGPWPPGAASNVYRHHALAVFRDRLAAAGAPLILRRGDSLTVLRALIAETGADKVVWNRRYEPAACASDRAVRDGLRDNGVEAVELPGNLLFEPEEVKNKQGAPYKVFTPFWRMAMSQQHDAAPPVPGVRTLHVPSTIPASLPLDELGLLPAGEGRWPERMMEHWNVGEESAWRRARAFLRDDLFSYEDDRDHPAEDGSSRLSAPLHHGEIGVRRLWAALDEADPPDEAGRESLDRFRAELGWREFAHHLIVHFPDTPNHCLRPEFRSFPWDDDGASRGAWQRGRTGYPMVDAAMRQLWQTGWMHNRARMIVASFLTKDLLLPWRDGARWFWDTLVDADLANNTLGWQWAAGCGADAAPYFRIFNPVTQGLRYDPDGNYVRRWVGELRRWADREELDGKMVHEPWKNGAELGRDRRWSNRRYPEPIVDHKWARERALAAYDTIKGGS